MTPFSILVVCTGNICRSPQAERLARAEFARYGLGAEVALASAGTAALVGREMEAEAAELTRIYGGDPEGHIARSLAPQMIESSDLVLTMERRHRAEVVRMLPRASRFAFTLPEFARLTAALKRAGAECPDAPLPVADCFRYLIPQVAAERGIHPPGDAKADEIEDPYRRSSEAYARSASAIVSAVRASVADLVELARGGGQ